MGCQGGGHPPGAAVSSHQTAQPTTHSPTLLWMWQQDPSAVSARLLGPDPGAPELNGSGRGENIAAASEGWETAAGGQNQGRAVPTRARCGRGPEAINFLF